MTLQEMAVLVDEEPAGEDRHLQQWLPRHGPPVAAALLRQELRLGGDDPAGLRASSPTPTAFARIRVETKAEVARAIREARAHKGPILLDFQIDQEENVWPMVPAGAALSETIEAPAEELAR